MQRIEFRFNDSQIRPDLNQVQSGEVVTTLQPLTMDVLMYLLENAGQLVSTDELLDQFWTGRHSDPSMVARCVTQIRSALGDSARAPAYIATIRKRGYRTVGVVEQIGSVTNPLVDVDNSVEGPGEPRTSAALVTSPTAAPSRVRILSFVVCVGLLFGLFLFLPVSMDESQTTKATVEVDKVASEANPDISLSLKPVVAVAPLRDLSPASDLGWLAAGITAEIRRQISSWGGYEVLHRSLSDVGTGTLQDLPANLLLDGYLQTNKGSVTLVLSLVELPSGKMSWQDEFVGDPEDPLAMQIRIANIVARYFNESAPLNSYGFNVPQQPKSYQAYLKSLHTTVVGDVDEEIYWIEKALAIEPEWIDGWRRLVMSNGIAWNVTGQQHYMERANQAMARLAEDPYSVFHRIYHTAYLIGDIATAEQIARDWVIQSNHPYAIYSYARIMQESGLHVEAARVFQHFTEEVPAEHAGWEGLYVNLLLTQDFAGAKAAAEQYALMLPLRSGEAANSARMRVAAVSGDIELATELLNKHAVLQAQYKPDSFMEISTRWALGEAQFLLALAKGDKETAEHLARKVGEFGGHRVSALRYLRIGSEEAARTQFNLAKSRVPQTGLFVWASAKSTLEPSQFDHPLVLDYEAHLGIGRAWQRELCANAASMPKESLIDCDLAQFD